MCIILTDANGNELTENDEEEEQQEEQVCRRVKGEMYIRLACWSFNTSKDIEALNHVLTNNLQLSTTSNEALRRQFIFMCELYERLFSTLTSGESYIFNFSMYDLSFDSLNFLGT